MKIRKKKERKRLGRSAQAHAQLQNPILPHKSFTRKGEKTTTQTKYAKPSKLSNFAARSKKRSNRFACLFYYMLLGLLKEIRGAELGIIPDETPPNVGKRDCGGMPKRMGIHISFIWREIIDF